MNRFWAMVRFTLRDMARDRSVYVMAALVLVFIMVFRGCLGGTYTINDQQVERVTLIWHLARGAFHVVGIVALAIAALLTTGLLRRDRGDGVLVTTLSRPVARSQYILARISGVFVVVSLFMIVMHAVILVLAYLQSGAWIPRFAAASLLCTLNIGFIVLLTALLAVRLPDFAALLVAAVVVGVSFISEWVFRISTSESVGSVIPGLSPAQTAWWRMAWPKLGELQAFAVSLTDQSSLQIMGQLHPVVQMTGYTVLAAFLLVVLFNREEL